LVLVVFNLAYVLLAYPAGALSDRASARAILAGGIACLVVADLVLAADVGLAGLAVGVSLWGTHMALTQGLFAKLVADSAPGALRATSFGAFHFASGIATLLASLAAGFLWDKGGPAMTFTAGAAVAGVSLMMLGLLPNAGVRPS
jgi:MFS family permease